jgi:hypothetical protein
MKTIQRRAHIRDFVCFPVITAQLFTQQEGVQIGNMCRILVTLLKREAISGGKKSRRENIKVDDSDNL